MERPTNNSKNLRPTVQSIHFQVIGACRWQIEGGQDARGNPVLTPPPEGRPFELLFFLACRPDMQATRKEISDLFWPTDKRPVSPENTLKTWLTQLTASGKLPGGKEWQRRFPITATADYVRLSDACTSDVQEFWKLQREAEREQNVRVKKAKIERMRDMERQQLMPRPPWQWVYRLRGEMRQTLEALEKTLPEVLPAEDIPYPGELPGNLTYPRNSYFEGREEIFAALCEQLTGTGISAPMQALAGMGGMGKTETAVEFAYRCFSKERNPGYPAYTCCLWTRADDADALRNGYASLARVLPDFPYRDEQDTDVLIPAVIRWLADPKHRGWLLIFDNADRPELLREFLPRYPDRWQGQILLTSRSPHFPAGVHRIAIDPLSSDEAVRFLCHRSGRTSLEEGTEWTAACEIVRELGGLSLALGQSAAFLHQHPALTFADYLAAYHTRTQDLMRFQEEARPYLAFQTSTGVYTENLTVWTTWDLNFREVAEQFPDSADLLNLSACLAPAPIPNELLLAVREDSSLEREEFSADTRGSMVDRLLNPLHNYSLVNLLPAEQTFSVHQLIQAVVWDKLSPEVHKKTIEKAIRWMARSFPSEDYVVGGRGALYYPHAQRLHAYIAENAIEGEDVAILLDHIALFSDRQGRYEEAEALYQQAFAVRQQILPNAHLSIAMSLHNLAELYRSQGRFEAAEPLSLRALAIRQNNLPADDPEIAASLNSLAELYRNQGRFEEAKPLYLQAIEICRGVPVNVRTEIAAVLNNLALVHWHQGRYSEAEPLLKEALELNSRSLSDGHPEIAANLNNLALTYQRQGLMGQAEAFLRKALTMRQMQLPVGHPDIAQSLSNLGVLYRRLERYAEAEALYTEALAIRRNALPPDHPDIASDLTNLAVLYRRQGRPDEAEPLCLEAMRIYKSAFSEDHPEYAASLSQLAQVYQSQRRFSEAEPLFHQALVKWQNSLPDNHLDIAAGLNQLAEVYQVQQRFSEAAPLFRQAADILLSRFGPDDPDYRAVSANYETCLRGTPSLDASVTS